MSITGRKLADGKESEVVGAIPSKSLGKGPLSQILVRLGKDR